MFLEIDKNINFCFVDEALINVPLFQANFCWYCTNILVQLGLIFNFCIFFVHV
jgi:hypothetical protein